MTGLRTWTITGLGAAMLVVGVLLAGMAVSSAQEETAAPSAAVDQTSGAPSSDDAGVQGGSTITGSARLTPEMQTSLEEGKVYSDSAGIIQVGPGESANR